MLRQMRLGQFTLCHKGLNPQGKLSRKTIARRKRAQAQRSA